MGIINRNLSASEQRLVLQQEYAPTTLVTGATNVVTVIPTPCSLDFISYAAFGVSGSPTALFIVNRFIPGTGLTSFPLGSTSLVTAFGTSGVLASGVSIPVIGSTLTQLQTNDVLMLQMGGANSALTGLSVSVALRPLQDIVKLFNVLS